MLVQHFLENSAKKLPQKIALICGEQRLSYKEINDSANRLAASLIEMDVKRQDRVIIFLDNSVESVIALFGIMKAGAIFVMLNPTMKTKKLNYILNDSGASTLITQKNKYRIVSEATDDAPELKNIIWVGKPPDASKKTSSTLNNVLWEDLFSSPSAFSLQPLASSIDVDLAAIIYTSASSGEPKGVMSAHYNVVAAAQNIIAYLGNGKDDIILNALPLSFDYGLYQVLMSFLFGGTVVLERSFNYPYELLKKITQERATGFPIVPTMLAILLQMENLKKFDLSSLRYISSTGAVLPVPYIKKLREHLPHVKVYSMYGLTECKRVSYLPPEDIDRKSDSVGIPMANEEVFIMNEENREVVAGEVGELVVRGSHVMQGYWNSPEETAKRFRPGRYRGDTILYTGDLFRKDEEGYLYFVARKDDMIKTRGELVSPKEIEAILYGLEGVAEAVVIGIQDSVLGQAIKTFIVSEDAHKLTESQVKEYCRREIESFIVPKYVEFLKSIPKSSNGKVNWIQLNDISYKMVN